MDVIEQIALWVASPEAQQPLLVVTEPVPTLATLIPSMTDMSVEVVALPEEGKITIKHIHDLLDRISTTTINGSRLIWIPDAERLLPAAANALLKTLEQNRTANRFLLTSPHPGRILATIRSRCRILRLRRGQAVVEPKAITFDPKRKEAVSLPEAEAIGAALLQSIKTKGARTATTRSLMRLRDYYRATAQGVGQKAASDALLASLTDDVY